MGYERRMDRAIALAVVVLAEAVCIGGLLRWRIGPQRAPVHDEAIVVEFIQRPARRPAAPGVRSTRGVPTPRRPRRIGLASAPPSVETPRANTADPPAARALDLQLPDSGTAVIRRFAPDPRFERRPARTGASTRFEAAWQGDGTVLDVARRRSVVLGAALSLFGPPPRHCDEVDRRLRKPDCLNEPDDEPIEP